jgi:hypothetical protein
MPKIVLPGQNVAIQKPHGEIDPIWYEKLKGWESWINLVSAIFPSGPATPTTPATALHASLGADVALNSSTYTDGPSIAQGSTGTWWVSGLVTVTDTAAFDVFKAKLWDGTNVIASTAGVVRNATDNIVLALSGFMPAPAGNLKISVIGSTATGVMKFNASGNSKDSTISAFRIA